MAIISSSVSITRYRVEGKLKSPIMDRIKQGLQKYCIDDIDNEDAEKAVGWTSFDQPFEPDFEGSSFMIGTNFVFALRIDKKSIPAKIVQKHCALEGAKRIRESGRDFLSRNEKKLIKDHVITMLSMRIPSTPNIFDLIWNYEEASLWFFTNLKNANEELETLFSKSFRMTLIRLFPYTMAELTCGLADPEKDVLARLKPVNFAE
jgi:DNA recombination-dependent growth factor C